MLLLKEEQVEELLSAELAIKASKHAFIALFTKSSNIPTRTIFPVSDYGYSLFKPGIVSHENSLTLGLKVVHVRNGNLTLKPVLPTVPATISLFDPITGMPLCFMGATFLTAMRTAAGSALATELLSSTSSERLVVFGAGLQAFCHILTILEVRDIKQIFILNRTFDRANKLIERLKTTFKLKIDFEALLLKDLEKANEILSKADIVCTTTASSEPLFDGNVLKPTCHINAVGSYLPTTTELDEACIDRSAVVVDCEEALKVGDLTPLKESGLIGTLGECLTNKIDDKYLKQVTIFKSVGTAVQDLYSAKFVYEAAKLNSTEYLSFSP